MTIESINLIIENYTKLNNLVKDKVKILQANDSDMYNIMHGINDISFEDQLVYCTCDYGISGDLEVYTFSFPIEWLSLDDIQLKNVILNNKQDRLLRTKEEMETTDIQRLLDLEQQELETYERLKAKFANAGLNRGKQERH